MRGSTVRPGTVGAWGSRARPPARAAGRGGVEEGGGVAQRGGREGARGGPVEGLARRYARERIAL